MDGFLEGCLGAILGIFLGAGGVGCPLRVLDGFSIGCSWILVGSG